MLAISKYVLAKLKWISQTRLQLNIPYLINYTGQTLCGCITRVRHEINDSQFMQQNATTLQVNNIGIVELETHKPMVCDPYTSNRTTGSLVMIDPVDGHTVAEGMILETSARHDTSKESASAGDFRSAAARSQPIGLTVWFTGLSGCGKTTIGRSVYSELLAQGIRTEFLDADDLRKHLNRDLGFSKEDRDENIRRIGFVAHLLTRSGVVALVAAISPYRTTRAEVRRSIGNFLEVYVNTPLSVCESRDPKGLYKKARAGELRGFTGVDDPYEPPLSPEIECDTNQESLKVSTDKVVSAVLRFLSSDQP
jgi:adenylyl-sulfate kinase